MSRNMLLAAINKADDGIFTEGSQVSSLPIENLTDRQISKVWRTATTTAPDVSGSTRDTTSGRTWFEVDLGVNTTLDYIGLLRHNITRDGQIRVRISTVFDFSSLVYDSGLVNAWPTVTGYGSLPWGTFSWGNVLSAPDLSIYTIDFHHPLDTAVVGRYVRVDIVNASNPDTFIEAGRFYASPSYFPSINIQYGFAIYWKDDSLVSKSLGGQRFVQQKSRYRRMEMSFSEIPEVEAYTNLFDFIQRRKGISGDLVIIPQPDRPELFIHEAIYCSLVQMDPVQKNYYGVLETKMVVEELL